MAVRDGSSAEGVAVRGHPVLDRVPAVALALAPIASIQFGAALATTLFDELGAAGTSALRLGFAALIMLVVWRPRPWAYPRRDLRLAVIFGVCLGAMNLTFYEALARIPLGVAVTIEFAGPLGLAVATSRRRLDLAWATMAALGIVLLTDPFGQPVDAVGALFAAAAGGLWAGYIVLAQRTGRVFSGSQGLAMAMVVGALVPLGPGVAEAGRTLLEPHFLALGAVIALLSSAIPYTLETEALRRLPTSVFGILMSLEPAVAALAGFIVLSQALGAVDVVAIALVVAASVGVSRTTRPPEA